MLPFVFLLTHKPTFFLWQFWFLSPLNKSTEDASFFFSIQGYTSPEVNVFKNSSEKTYLQPCLLFIFIFHPPSGQCLLFLAKGWYLVSAAVNCIMGVFCYHSSHWLLHSCVGNWDQSPWPKTLPGQVVQSWVKLSQLTKVSAKFESLKKEKFNSSCFSIISS